MNPTEDKTPQHNTFAEKGQAKHAAERSDSLEQIILDRHQSRQHFHDYLKLKVQLLADCDKNRKPIPILLTVAICLDTIAVIEAEDSANIAIEEAIKKAEHEKRHSDEKQIEIVENALKAKISKERGKVADTLAGPMARNFVEKESKPSAWEIGPLVDALIKENNGEEPIITYYDGKRVEGKYSVVDAIEFVSEDKGIHKADVNAAWQEYKKLGGDVLKIIEEELGTYKPTLEERLNSWLRQGPPTTIK